MAPPDIRLFLLCAVLTTACSSADENSSPVQQQRKRYHGVPRYRYRGYYGTPHSRPYHRAPYAWRPYWKKYPRPYPYTYNYPSPPDTSTSPHPYPSPADSSDQYKYPNVPHVGDHANEANGRHNGESDRNDGIVDPESGDSVNEEYPKYHHETDEEQNADHHRHNGYGSGYHEAYPEVGKGGSSIRGKDSHRHHHHPDTGHYGGHRYHGHPPHDPDYPTPDRHNDGREKKSMFFDTVSMSLTDFTDSSSMSSLAVFNSSSQASTGSSMVSSMGGESLTAANSSAASGQSSQSVVPPEGLAQSSADPNLQRGLTLFAALGATAATSMGPLRQASPSQTSLLPTNVETAAEHLNDVDHNH